MIAFSHIHSDTTSGYKKLVNVSGLNSFAHNIFAAGRGGGGVEPREDGGAEEVSQYMLDFKPTVQFYGSYVSLQLRCCCCNLLWG